MATQRGTRDILIDAANKEMTDRQYKQSIASQLLGIGTDAAGQMGTLSNQLGLGRTSALSDIAGQQINMGNQNVQNSLEAQKSNQAAALEIERLRQSGQISNQEADLERQKLDAASKATYGTMDFNNATQNVSQYNKLADVLANFDNTQKQQIFENMLKAFGASTGAASQAAGQAGQNYATGVGAWKELNAQNTAQGQGILDLINAFSNNKKKKTTSYPLSDSSVKNLTFK